jgi:hypothetical protein
MAKVSMQTARTTEADPVRAVEALLAGLSGPPPKLVVMFASRSRDQRALNRVMRERLPKQTRLFGSTTGGEVDNHGMHQGSIVIGALYGDLEVGLGIGRNLAQDAMSAGANAVAEAARGLGTAVADLDPRKHVGVVIDDGFKWKKEELLLGALETNPELSLVGGGAGDSEPDISKASAQIHIDGEVVDDAVALALVRTDAPFAALRSHWYEPSGQMLTISKLDDSHTRALEIDGKPAAARYAELLGVGIDELEFGKPRGFAVRPVALRVGKEYFMRSPWKPLPDGSILFPALLEQGAQLELMRLGDPVGSTREFLENLGDKVKSPQAALLFHCGARAGFAYATGQADALGKAFAAGPTSVGFNVFFEIYQGFNINTTLTSLVFGEG